MALLCTSGHVRKHWAKSAYVTILTDTPLLDDHRPDSANALGLLLNLADTDLAHRRLDARITRRAAIGHRGTAPLPSSATTFLHPRRCGFPSWQGAQDKRIPHQRD